MKKTIFATISAAMITFAAQASEIEAVFHYPAGGGVDSATAGVWTAIENTSDYRVKKIYYKSCAEAVNHVKTRPNSLLATVSVVLNLQGSTSVCPDAPSAGIKLQSLVSSSSVYLCTAPNTPQLTVEDLTGTRSYKIAALTSKVGTGAITAFLKAIGSNSRVIPYANAVELRAAAISGDVDYVFAGNGIPELVTVGSRCLAASSTDNLRNVPSLGEFTESGFPEFRISSVLFTVHSNPDISDAIERAMKSEAFQQFVSSREGIHLGLGSEHTVEQQTEILINDYNTVDNF